MCRTPLLTIALVIAGCATDTWTKPGASIEERKMEAYECERDARQSMYFGTGVIGSLNLQDFEARCLEAHGWVKVAN